MAIIQEHYDNHLGPIYTWMHGGTDTAIASGAADVAKIAESLSRTGLAVDLGAGFGMHAIPLARQGFRVVAIDTCAALLEELRSHQDNLQIETVHDDLQSFRQYLPQPPLLVLCMGDTLTHLPDHDSVTRLIGAVSSEMETGGHFVITLRDYSTALTGEQRFIQVRSTERRILTCFLEYTASHVTVHDIVHEWNGTRWTMAVSAYRKLRLSPVWLVNALKVNHFAVEQRIGMSGMVHLTAHRV
jgi:hypothetical protein